MPTTRTTEEPCRKCKGTGSALYSPLYPVQCNACKGTGIDRAMQTLSVRDEQIEQAQRLTANSLDVMTPGCTQASADEANGD